MKLYIFIVFFSLLTSLSSGKCIYVNGKFVGNGDGTLTSPFTTIQEAVNSAASGDTIFIYQGTYREEVIIKSSGITIMPFGNDLVEISGTELLLSWEKVADGVYKTFMGWDITASDQSNQIFWKKEMMHLCRWPQNTGSLILPSNAYANNVVFEGENTVILDDDFKEPAGKWDGCEIWINLSRTQPDGTIGWDGQGWTGKVLSTQQGRIVVSGKISGLIGDQAWGMGPNLEYFLFNPLSIAVSAKGGIQNYLKPGEWWKKGDTLFVKTPDGKVPDENACVEAKRRLYAFALENQHDILIRDIDLFGCSVNTDYKDFFTKTTLAGAYNITFDNLHAKYVTHFTNQSKNWQMQWVQRSGFILSGTNITLKNSTIQYSAGSGISVFGKDNKILNNLIIDCNYSSSECGAINTGLQYDPALTLSQDHEIAYNTISNTPQQAVNIRALSNSSVVTPGRARIHHNILSNFMLKTHDSGGFDTFSSDGKWVRLDHNIFHDAINYMTMAFYLDFGLRYILDHNLFYRVDRPIQFNYRSDLLSGPLFAFNNTALADKVGKSGIFNGIGSYGPGFNVQNNITTRYIANADGGPWAFSNIHLESESDYDRFFTDAKNDDYSIKEGFSDAINTGEWLPFLDKVNGEKPDLGCFESGFPAWEAGYGKIKPEFVLSDSAFFLKTNYGQASNWTFPVRAIPYCGFEGIIMLELKSVPEGIEVQVSKDSVSENEVFHVSIQTNNLMGLGKHHFYLKGTSGNFTNVRTYVIEVPQIISSLKIQNTDTVVKYGTTVQMTALAYDQEGNEMKVQPSFKWKCIGGGQINNTGKYTASRLSDSVMVIAIYQEITDTIRFKVVNISSIYEISDISKQLKIYPNPANDKIWVSYKSEQHGTVTLNLYNSAGEKVIHFEKKVQAGENTHMLDLEAVNPGFYLLELICNDIKQKTKFIVRH